MEKVARLVTGKPGKEVVMNGSEDQGRGNLLGEADKHKEA